MRNRLPACTSPWGVASDGVSARCEGNGPGDDGDSSFTSLDVFVGGVGGESSLHAVSPSAASIPRLPEITVFRFMCYRSPFVATGIDALEDDLERRACLLAGILAHRVQHMVTAQEVADAPNAADLALRIGRQAAE